MKTLRICISAIFILESVSAYADKYGIDESIAESEGSWGAIVLVVILFAYLHFKKK